MDDSLLDYALEIIEQTRQNERLVLGVSPRGSLMLQRAAQARAFIEGRDFCLPDDFKQLVLPVFAHRVVVNARYATTQKKVGASRGHPLRNSGIHARPAVTAMASTDFAKHHAPPKRELWRAKVDWPAWRTFAIAVVSLGAALLLALYSSVAAEDGRTSAAAFSALSALALSAWVAFTVVPVLARRTPLRWLAYRMDYRVTREGIVYLAGIFVIALAALNTGNNLLFMMLACLLAGILISGIAFADRAERRGAAPGPARTYLRRPAGHGAGGVDQP